MNFEKKILAVSHAKEKNLLQPSSVAMVKPDTGVEIKKKSAYYVIRDCATIAHDYIPHKCYSTLDKPIQQLYGKFSKADIIEFVSRTKQHQHTKQLLYIIFSDIYKQEADEWSPPPMPEQTEVLEIDADADGDEIYGDYGYEEDEVASQSITMPVKPPIDLGDGEAVITKLIETFGAHKDS